jgi:hypothetical protein
MRTMRLLGLCAVVIGFWLMVAPGLVLHGSHWQNIVNDVAIGGLVVSAGLWRAYGTRGARWSTVSLAVLGLIEFLSPWLYGQTLPAGRWNAWVMGLLLMALAGIIYTYHPKDQPLHFTLVPNLIPTEPVIPFRQRAKRKEAADKGPRRRRRRSTEG